MELKPLISSTVTNEGCDITAAWISRALANSATTFAECDGRHTTLSRANLQNMRTEVIHYRNPVKGTNGTHHPSNNLQLQ